MHAGGEGDCSCCEWCSAFPSLSRTAFIGSCSTGLSVCVCAFGLWVVAGVIPVSGPEIPLSSGRHSLVSLVCGRVVMHRASHVVCGFLLDVCSPVGLLLSLISLQWRLSMRASLIAPCALLSLISLGGCRHLRVHRKPCLCLAIHQSKPCSRLCERAPPFICTVACTKSEEVPDCMHPVRGPLPRQGSVPCGSRLRQPCSLGVLAASA